MDERQAFEFYSDPANQVPAGPAQRREGRRLSATVPVRFPQEVIAAVKRFASQDGVTVSTWIRLLVAKEIKRREPPATVTTSEPRLGVQFDNVPAISTSGTGSRELLPC